MHAYVHLFKEVIKSGFKLMLGKGIRKSYGQFGEDAYIQALLKDVKYGFYVDVGAYHPVLYSNTYALYSQGWKGIAIDPNPTLRSLYRIFRPRDTFVCAAIGAQEAEATYHMFSDGAYNTFDQSDASARRKMSWLTYMGACPVRFRKLANILKDIRALPNIDFLNIDAEGHDLSVLESIEWSLMHPRVIAIEDDAFDIMTPEGSPIFRYLSERGYVLRGFNGLTLIWTSTNENGA